MTKGEKFELAQEAFDALENFESEFGIYDEAFTKKQFSEITGLLDKARALAEQRMEDLEDLED